MRPGRYERKESNIQTDVLMPVLQGSVCVLILFLDLVFWGLWIFILPPEADWVLGMLFFILIACGTLMGGWLGIRLWPYPFDKAAVRALGLTDFQHVRVQLKQAKTWVPMGLILLIVLVVSWFWVWDTWWDFCLEQNDISLPVPHLEGGSPLFLLGISIGLIGLLGIFLKPSKYVFGLTTFGGIISTAAHVLAPVQVWFTWERPFILYCLYLAWCLGFTIGTITLFFRMFFKEIPDPYIPEVTARTPVEIPMGTMPEPRSGVGEEAGL